jgi:hypothetical protein
LTKNFGHFCNLKKLPKVSNCPIGEKSANLVTLLSMEATLGEKWSSVGNDTKRMEREKLIKRTEIA